MTQAVQENRRQSPRVTTALVNAFVFAGALLSAPAILCSDASAQALGYASAPPSAFPSNHVGLAPNDPGLAEERDGSGGVLPARLRRAIVSLDTREPPGTIIIDTGNTALYYVLGQGRAIRYGVGVGREGFTWSGVQSISHKAEWPDWHPPAEMIARQPYLPRFMAGGPGNPLGARAMYLRLTNEDVADLFSRVDVGTKVVVLPKNAPHLEAQRANTGSVAVRSAAAPGRSAVTTLPSGRQAMNLSASSPY